MFFDLQTLIKESGNDPVIMIHMLENFFHKRLPSRGNRKYFSKKSLHGKSFIKNPLRLFALTNVSYAHKAQYVVLAGKMDYLTYKSYGLYGLDLSFFPDLDLNTVRGNPLLEVTDSFIKFKI